MSSWLQKLPPPPPPTGTEAKAAEAEAVKADEQAKDSDELQPGKLGDEGWVYGGYILREDPLRTQVFLHKKDPAAGTPPLPGALGSGRTSPRLKTSPLAQRTKRVTGRVTVQQPLDRVHFYVFERRYQNPELGLDFMIHSADAKQFVYWLSDDPGPKKKLFALQYVTESQYDQDPTQGLRPPPKSPEEAAAEASSETKKHFIKRSKKEFEDTREQEYQEWYGGTPPEVTDGDSSPGGLRTIEPPPGAAGAAPGSPPPPGAPPRPGTSPRAAELRGAPPKATAEQIKDLGEARKAMSPEDRKKWDEALKGIKLK